MSVAVAWVSGSAAAAVSLLAASPYLASASAAAAAAGPWWRWGVGSTTRRRTSTIAAGAAIAGGLCGRVARDSLGWWPAFLVFAAAAVVLAVVDLEHHRLPDQVLVPAIAVEVVLLVGAAAGSGQWSRLGQAGLGAVVLTVVMAALWVASRGDLGLGDVKLAPLLGLMLGWLGWRHLGLGVICGLGVAALAAGVLLAAGRDRRAHIPVGAALLVGAVVSCAVPIS